jgi:ubiquinone/menaquinone biosynthesis C-methylase UbiE
MEHKVQAYDKVADRYDRLFGPLETRFLSKWREEALSLLPSDSLILEIGAGTGLNFRFYPQNCRGVASEISSRMLCFARPKINAKKIVLVQADAEQLPFANDSFDAAFATLVFCSIPKPENAFGEIRRVVKNGGIVVLLEHVRPRGVLGYFFDFLNIFSVRLIEDHFNRQTALLAANSGLEIVEVREKVFGAVNLIVCRNPQTK